MSERGHDTPEPTAEQHPTSPEPGKVLQADGIALRGYELARLEGSTWVQVAHYRGTERGRRHAMSDAAYLNRMHPVKKWAARPIIAINSPFTVED